MNERLVEICSAATIAERVQVLAAEIAATHSEREVTVLGVTEDSFMLLADLLRAMRMPLKTAFLGYARRAHGGVQDLFFTTPIDVTGRNIVLVEGVLDTGIPQEYIIKQLEGRGAASVRLCVLLDKTGARRSSVRPDWRVFETAEEYVVGYGLGFQDRWRELPYLATFERE